VTHMLCVPTLEISNPVLLFVLMEADDPPWDRRACTCVTLHDNSSDALVRHCGELLWCSYLDHANRAILCIRK